MSGRAAGAAHGALAGLFSQQSSTYAAFRPRYPPQLYQAILRFAGLEAPEQRGLAVDLGCGSSQASADLAALFSRVIGIDASAEQLAHADRSKPNVEYICKPVEHTGLPAQCADLIAAATALHWFDLPAAYREARRILKPGGALVAWTYTPWSALPRGGGANAPPAQAPDLEAADRLQEGLVRQFWPFFHPVLQKVTVLRNGYAGFEPSSADFGEVRLETIDMTVDMTMDQMVGWVQSWSAYVLYCEEHGEEAAQQLLQRYRADMAAALRLADGSTPVPTRWPLHLLLARQPLPLEGTEGQQAIMRAATFVVLCALLGCVAARGDRLWKNWENPCRNQPDGVAVGTGGCNNEFVPCWHGRPAAIQQCPAGLVFSPWVQSCVYPGAVGTYGCKCLKIYKRDKAQQVACEVCRFNNELGVYPFPGERKKFVECTMQGAFVKKCAGGRFSKHHGQCV